VSRELSEIAYYNLIKMSIPILIPNTPYINNTNASYVEQALTGFLLGDGVLVKKYKNGGTYFKFAQSEIHLDYLKLVFNLFKNLGIVLMETPSPGKSNIKGKVIIGINFQPNLLNLEMTYMHYDILMVLNQFLEIFLNY
jgi:hypothetical protein